MSEASDPVVGIDLGTTNSEVAAYVGDRVRVLGPAGAAILPSCVGLSPEGELLYPERTVRSIKRKMGSEATVKLGERSFTPPEISAVIVKTLVSMAEEQLGQPVRRAVITVPAYFSDAQRRRRPGTTHRARLRPRRRHLRRVDLRASELDDVLLVGGSTRTPLVARSLLERTGRPPRCEVHPDLCVALGAGVLASRLAGLAVEHVLVEVSPFSFGSHLGMRGGFPYPQIYQGEDEDALRNIPVGEFHVVGLEPTEEPNEILCRMSLDVEGLLRVAAIEKSTGKSKEIVIQHALEPRTEEEIAAARERMRRLFEGHRSERAFDSAAEGKGPERSRDRRRRGGTSDGPGRAIGRRAVERPRRRLGARARRGAPARGPLPGAPRLDARRRPRGGGRPGRANRGSRRRVGRGGPRGGGGKAARAALLRRGAMSAEPLPQRLARPTSESRRARADARPSVAGPLPPPAWGGTGWGVDR